MSKHALKCLLGMLLLGCGSNPAGGNGAADGGVGNEGWLGATTDGGFSLGDVTTGDAQSGCSEAAKLVYVVEYSTGNELRSFNPATLEFHDIGTITGCTPGAWKGGLAISRDGVAYVEYGSAGGLFTLSLTDASCHPVPGYQPSAESIWGPAFVNQNGSDSMYTCTITGSEGGLSSAGGPLARIELPTYSLQTVGDYTSALQGDLCKLTGTGDGRLFGLFENQMASTAALAEIDTTSGATPSPTDMSSLNQSASEASVVFWGGDFWFFTSNLSSPGSSQVIRYKYSTDKSLVVEVADTGFSISGAAVSTCAPLTINK